MYRPKLSIVIGLLACGLGLLLPSERACADGPVRFVVSEFPDRVFRHDAYTLELTRAADIAHARDLIARGVDAGQPLVVARIVPGGDGINRNHGVAGAPLWSWHIDRFDSFADVTIEILDGWPSYVESDIPGWIDNTGGYIGFWSYTVTAELPGMTPSCPADFNRSGTVTMQDVFDFLAAYFGNDPRADFNTSGAITVQDIFDFLAAWFAGC